MQTISGPEFRTRAGAPCLGGPGRAYEPGRPSIRQATDVVNPLRMGPHVATH